MRESGAPILLVPARICLEAAVRDQHDLRLLPEPELQPMKQMLAMSARIVGDRRRLLVVKRKTFARVELYRL
jgi:hypothetical protein